MNNRQAMVLLIICAALAGAAIFWLGTKNGSKQTREDIQMGGHYLFESLTSTLTVSESIGPEPTRQIGFHANNLA